MDRRRRFATAIGGAGLALAVVAGSALAADESVAISGFSFSPRTVTVGVGDTVTWTNSDAQAHTATSGSDWNTGDITRGASASITFRSAGTFDYICAIHPTMTGRVVVQASATGTTPPTDTATPTSVGRGGKGPVPTLGLLAVVLVVGSIVAHGHFARRRSGG